MGGGLCTIRQKLVCSKTTVVLVAMPESVNLGSIMRSRKAVTGLTLGGTYADSNCRWIFWEASL